MSLSLSTGIFAETGNPPCNPGFPAKRSMARFQAFLLPWLLLCLGLTPCGAEPVPTNGIPPDTPLSRLVPAEKHLDPGWLASLGSRGQPQVFKGSDLKFIGMPVGGLFAGQLYLGGDGQLWHWDVFNEHRFTGSGHYARPMVPSSPLEQRFTLGIGGRTIPVGSAGFSDISFRGEYPVGTVTYKDPKVPVSVTLEAFSPFVPLDLEDSSLPATIMRFTLANGSAAPVKASLTGILENAVLLRHRELIGTRSTGIVGTGDGTFLNCTAKANGDPCLEDQGSMTLALLGAPADSRSENRREPLNQKSVGSLGRTVRLAPKESKTVTFVIAWFFPDLNHLPHLKDQGRWYSRKFSSASQVAEYVATHEKELTGETFLWRKTWYDSTLPYWLLDRTFINTSILATGTSYRLADGRYWAWEGVADCPGTCGHVYGYAQAAGRLFPGLEREQRETVDFGISQNPDGAIRFRGENNGFPAIDAQAGYVLRALREHLVSKDDDFLKRIWPKVRLATDWLIAKDGKESGIIHGNQHNTLDSDWFGENAWLSGLYQAALLASAEMADRANDPDYAVRCRRIAAAGRDSMATNLFNGEYYQNKVDPAHPEAINSGSGCEIDQVMGQGWAFQVGLPRVFPKEQTVKSLQSLWKYNFAPDVGPYREVNKPGRWYAMPGEAGLLMCTFPKSDWDYRRAAGQGNPGFVGYFNECMNGFEHQVAGHIIWEGEPDSDLVTKGLAIERALHDRYAPSKRNPYNEIECGDHYGRSMASYGVFLAACGFEYDGPRGHIGFAPKIHPEDFKAAFTAAEGWGSYSQRITGSDMTAEFAVKWGKVTLNSFSLASKGPSAGFKAMLDGKEIPAEVTGNDGKVTVALRPSVIVPVGHSLVLHLPYPSGTTACK
jgi:non-lysosomal glucosylceramidase